MAGNTPYHVPMSHLDLTPTAAQLGLGMGTEVVYDKRVDVSNWTLPPYNRWSFQHVQQMTRTCRVARAATPQPFELDLRDLAGLEPMLECTWTDAFAVVHEGRLVFEQYRNGMQPDTLHLMMSCSKSMTSTLVGIAHESGHLSLNANVDRYLPELAKSALADASIQNLLDMQVGVLWNEDYEDLEGHWRDLEVASGWREPYEGYALPLNQLDYMKTLTDREGAHGTAFHYQSVLTDVLGLCLERALGERFDAAFARLVWQPMGAEYDLVSIIDQGGYPAFEGGFNCSLRDFARFGWMIASGGQAMNGTQVVPGQWLDACRFPAGRLTEIFARSEYAELMPGHAYHNCWWVRDPRRGVLMALGIHGQLLYIDPERRFVAAKFSSQPAHVDAELSLMQFEALDALSKEMPT